MDDAWTLGVADLALAFREGSLDPTVVVQALRARIARVDPVLNAYVALAPDLEDQARHSAERLRNGAARSALEGVPIAVKDNLRVAGMPATWGSAGFAGSDCEEDEVPIARLRAAGAILVGKTNTPEFAVEGYTSNAMFGTTRNPFDPSLTPGGSSGGTVAAVASGMAAAGIGTDGGGSIRRPAGHCGLFGLKPGIGTVARGNGLPQLLMDFEVVGAMARSARDLRMVHEVLAGPVRQDPASRREMRQRAHQGPLNILFIERFGDNPCDPRILAAARAFADRMGAMGHQIVCGDMPLDLRPLDAFWPKFAQIGLASLFERRPEISAKAGARYLEMAREGASIAASELFAALQDVQRLRAETSMLFEQWDVLMTPSAAAQPWPAEMSHPDVIDGQTVGGRGHAIYTGWVNAVGHPAIAVPADADAKGLPIGVQLVGDLGQETQLLDLAESVTAAPQPFRFAQV